MDNTNTDSKLLFLKVVLFIVICGIILYIFKLPLLLDKKGKNKEVVVRSRFFCQSNAKKITLYDYPNYEGNSKELCIGYLTADDSFKIGSVKIPNGMSLEIFNKPNLKGDKIKLVNDTSNTTNINDVYSIRINTLDSELSNYMFNIDQI